MLTIVMAMLTNLITIFPGGGAYLWTPPPPVEIAVRRGQSAVFYVRAYKPSPACMSIPPVMVDAYPRTQLGSISTSPASMVGNGPCGVKKYAIQKVIYTAGPTQGTESFQVYFYMTNGKRDQRRVNVMIR